MSALTFDVPLPEHTPFLRWARILLEELAGYNVPNPVSEDLWLQWAIQVFAVPELVDQGVADPRAFGRWQDWALTFLQVPN